MADERKGDRHRTKAVAMRLDPELWAEFKQKVKERGGTIAAVVSRLLRDYIDYG